QHGREIARQWELAPLTETTQLIEPVEETITCTAADLGTKMQCSVCQWIYDGALGEPLQFVARGTPWFDEPDNFLCAECSLGID
ncbi:rubredoxin, partial [Salmonella enterica]|uniref:rubredoxin n=1 Tax=Salmonella enterica TaxID=28901 RepID=UPI00398C5F40